MDTAPRPIAPTKAEAAFLDPFVGLSLDRIFVPETPDEFDEARQEILAAGRAGFDTESRPTFRVGQKSDGPHVVQFALPSKAWLFQLHHPEARLAASELLQSDQVLKIGFGLANDHSQIRHKLGVTLRAVADLDRVFRKLGYRGQIGVRGAVAVVLQQRFTKSKSTTTSNWSHPRLTPAQKLYAANDAYAALKVYEALDQPS